METGQLDDGYKNSFPFTNINIFACCNLSLYLLIRKHNFYVEMRTKNNISDVVFVA